ncbi:hypothetical protein [Luteococcus peritonei]|uniref:Uncharacterized protein n=1 Tax=Luteococcus peritonei TaxID=88874 RepID=A0ABW4S044_9ACTN
MTISQYSKKFAAIVPAIALGLGLAAGPAQAASTDQSSKLLTSSSFKTVQDGKARIIWVS